MPPVRPVTPKSKRHAGAGAGVAGAGGGTVLTGIVQTMPDSTAKNILLYMVPSISVGLGVAWFFFSRQVMAWWYERAFQKEKDEAKKITEEQLRNDSNSPELKNEIRKNWESFQKSEIDRKLDHLKSLQELHLKYAQTADNSE